MLMSRFLSVTIEAGVAIAEVMSSRILDETNITLFGNELFALTDERKLDRIVLDMKRVAYMSSAANGKLMTFDKKMKAARGRWAICGIRPEIYEVYEITRLNKLFRFASGRAEAVAWLKGIASGQLIPVSVECPLVDCGTTISSSHPDTCRLPPAFETLPAACPSCGASFSLHGEWTHEITATTARVQQITLATYEGEHVTLLPSAKVEEAGAQQIGMICVVGRLDLYVAEAIGRLWLSLPNPAWIVLDLSRATEISEKGIRRLLEITQVDLVNRRASVLHPPGCADIVSASFPVGACFEDAVELLGSLPKENCRQMSILVRRIDPNERPA